MGDDEAMWESRHRSLKENRNTVDAADAVEDTFVLNVGGVKFETTLETLTAVPGSRLAAVGASGRCHEAYRARKGDYFFDRHPGAFDAVLQYHRCGTLHVNSGLCGNFLKEEFAYWGIKACLVEECCWDSYSRGLSSATDFGKLDRLFSDVDHPDEEAIKAMSLLRRFRTKAWLTLEVPSFSKMAQVYLGVTSVFTLASIIVFMAESHSSLSLSYCCNITDYNGTLLDGATYIPCDIVQNSSSSNVSWVIVKTDYVPALRYADFTVYGFFLLDFVLRAILSQRKKHFISSPANIVDLICIISQTIAISERYIINNSHVHDANSLLTSSTQWVRAFRLLRVFKILRHSIMVKVLAYTLFTAFQELVVVLMVLITFVVLFGSVAHYVESETFPTITYGCWWAIVTLTTVGFGDVTPKTPGGYVVGTTCVLCGVFSVAFTVPVVVSNFNTYYDHAKSREGRQSESKKEEDTRGSSPGIETTNRSEVRRRVKLTGYTKSLDDGSSLVGSKNSMKISATHASQRMGARETDLEFTIHSIGDEGRTRAAKCMAPCYGTAMWSKNCAYVVGEDEVRTGSMVTNGNETIR